MLLLLLLLLRKVTVITLCYSSGPGAHGHPARTPQPEPPIMYVFPEKTSNKKPPPPLVPWALGEKCRSTQHHSPSYVFLVHTFTLTVWAESLVFLTLT